MIILLSCVGLKIIYALDLHSCLHYCVCGVVLLLSEMSMFGLMVAEIISEFENSLSMRMAIGLGMEQFRYCLRGTNVEETRVI